VIPAAATAPLPLGAPSTEGVAAGGIISFLDALESQPGTEPHSLIVARHGRVVAAGWWAPYTPERLQHLYSVSKSFTATAAGLASAEGKLSFHDPVIKYFPEIAPAVQHPWARSMQVRHLATMATGHTEDTWPRLSAAPPEELVSAFLQLPPEREPGTVFTYNQMATYTLAAIVQRVTGRAISAYLRERLLAKAGAGEIAWRQYPPGQDIGYTGLFATTATVVLLGQLYLQDGSWEGRQLLPVGFVREATSHQISTAPPSGARGERPDWERGYGFQFWMSRHGYRADGAFGQFCLVLPHQDAVVAMTAQVTDMQAVLDTVWERLLPALAGKGGTGEGGPDAEQALQERLGRLSLPPLLAPASPPGEASGWEKVAFTPTGSPGEGQPSLLSVSVERGRDGWVVALSEEGWSLPGRLREGEWTVTDAPGKEGVPAAFSGGWFGPGTLRFDVVFLETPHRLMVTCKLPERVFEARWATAPLGAPALREMRAPRAAQL
jgi:CubicO group peptidase (beta-lactamase class C family)